MVKSGKETGFVAIGLIVAHALKGVAFKGEDGKGLIPDTLITNLAAAGLLVVGAATVQNPIAKTLLAGTAAYFAIRSINKATEKLNGLSGISDSVKTFLDKYVPKLGNVDEMDPSGGYDEPYMLPAAEMNPTAAGIGSPAALPAAPAAAPSPGQSFASRLW